MARAAKGLRKMPNVNDLFPSRFVKGEDLKGKAINVTIIQVTKEKGFRPGKGEQDIYVIYVERATKGIPLNKTLAIQIAEALGEPETTKWGGRQVCLYPQPMTVGGRDVIAIRARAVENHPGNGGG